MKVKFERCKKIFSMFLIIVLLFGILPVSALQGMFLILQLHE